MDIAGIEVPQSDWETTPESVKAVVTVLSERLAYIEEHLKQNSQNSSRPPSSDSVGTSAQSTRKTKPEHKRQQKSRRCDSSSKTPKLSPTESCSEVHVHVPQTCGHCGEALSGKDEQPHRHQVIEIPPLEAYVIEHQLHQLECACCGQKTRAALPEDVPTTGYGDRLAAIVAWLSGEHRQSHRMVESLLSTLFGIEVSRGSINRLRQQVSAAIASAVEEAHEFVRTQQVVHSDETGFSQGNGDGLNPTESKGWLWVLVTPLVAFFSVALSRSQGTAKSLLGEGFSGILNSDRYSAYNWLDVAHRQLCWAHLKRDLTAMAQRAGVSKAIGESLLRRERRLFRWWHRVRDGTLTREQFISAVELLRAGFRAELEAAAALPISNNEKSPLAKTVRTARKLLQVEAALWTFVYVSGVEPTNNLAERVLRPGVIWRKVSFGSQSAAGSEFVSRILTVVTSLKAQHRNPVEYLAQACRAKRLRISAPSLVPQLHDDTEAPVTG